MSADKTAHKLGLANNSEWNTSEGSFAPNTNVLDAETMPSDQAQAAREKSAQIMAALKAGDTERANGLMGKSETQGLILPGMGRLKKMLNKRKPSGVVEGQSVEEGEGVVGKGGKDDKVVR